MKRDATSRSRSEKVARKLTYGERTQLSELGQHADEEQSVRKKEFSEDEQKGEEDNTTNVERCSTLLRPEKRVTFELETSPKASSKPSTGDDAQEKSPDVSSKSTTRGDGNGSKRTTLAGLWSPIGETSEGATTMEMSSQLEQSADDSFMTAASFHTWKDISDHLSNMTIGDNERSEDYGEYSEDASFYSAGASFNVNPTSSPGLPSEVVSVKKSIKRDSRLPGHARRLSTGSVATARVNQDTMIQDSTSVLNASFPGAMQSQSRKNRRITWNIPPKVISWKISSQELFTTAIEEIPWTAPPKQSTPPKLVWNTPTEQQMSRLAEKQADECAMKSPTLSSPKSKIVAETSFSILEPGRCIKPTPVKAGSQQYAKRISLSTSGKIARVSKHEESSTRSSAKKETSYSEYGGEASRRHDHKRSLEREKFRKDRNRSLESREDQIEESASMRECGSLVEGTYRSPDNDQPTVQGGQRERRYEHKERQDTKSSRSTDNKDATRRKVVEKNRERYESKTGSYGSRKDEQRQMSSEDKERLERRARGQKSSDTRARHLERRRHSSERQKYWRNYSPDYRKPLQRGQGSEPSRTNPSERGRSTSPSYQKGEVRKTSPERWASPERRRANSPERDAYGYESGRKELEESYSLEQGGTYRPISREEYTTGLYREGTPNREKVAERRSTRSFERRNSLANRGYRYDARLDYIRSVSSSSPGRGRRSERIRSSSPVSSLSHNERRRRLSENRRASMMLNFDISAIESTDTYVALRYEPANSTDASVLFAPTSTMRSSDVSRMVKEKPDEEYQYEYLQSSLRQLMESRSDESKSTDSEDPLSAEREPVRNLMTEGEEYLSPHCSDEELPPFPLNLPDEFETFDASREIYSGMEDEESIEVCVACQLLALKTKQQMHTRQKYTGAKPRKTRRERFLKHLDITPQPLEPIIEERSRPSTSSSPGSTSPKNHPDPHDQSSPGSAHALQGGHHADDHTLITQQTVCYSSGHETAEFSDDLHDVTSQPSSNADGDAICLYCKLPTSRCTCVASIIPIDKVPFHVIVPVHVHAEPESPRSSTELMPATVAHSTYTEGQPSPLSISSYEMLSPITEQPQARQVQCIDAEQGRQRPTEQMELSRHERRRLTRMNRRRNRRSPNFWDGMITPTTETPSGSPLFSSMPSLRTQRRMCGEILINCYDWMCNSEDNNETKDGCCGGTTFYYWLTASFILEVALVMLGLSIYQRSTIGVIISFVLLVIGVSLLGWAAYRGEKRDTCCPQGEKCCASDSEIASIAY